MRSASGPVPRASSSSLSAADQAAGQIMRRHVGAESPADFTHKVRIALKEVRETRYWLNLVLRAELLEDAKVLPELIDEAGQLVAILTASANTARRRAERI